MRRALALALLAACAKTGDAPKGKLEMIDEPKVATPETLIAQEVVRARADHKQLLVYEGAPWCGPCIQFHAAAAVGQLDDEFPELRVLAFDADRDGEALASAGYMSELVPLFVVPGDDGRATSRRMEGGVPGGALADLVPRLHALLAQ
jgi:hypothetical protein